MVISDNQKLYKGDSKMSESSNNPLLSKVKLPGRIFQLPSRGLFYADGELDESVKDGEVHVRPMSAIDEITMKNPDLLFSGKAIDEVFRICIDGVNKPGRLLSKDVDAIMMYLRTVTYGPNYEFIARHTCKDAKDHSYIADVDAMIGQMKMIDPTTVADVYTLTMPNGQVLKLQPNRYDQVITIIRDNQGKKQLSADDMKNNLMQMVLGIIVSVDDITDPKLIEEWIRAIPAPWTNKIAEKVDGVNLWGPDLSWTVKCKDCGENYVVNIPLNPVSFFTE